MKIVLESFAVIHDVGVAILRPPGGIAQCSQIDLIDKAVDKAVHLVVVDENKAVPVLEHHLLEMRELGNLANPSLSESRAVIDEPVGSAVVGIAEVPHRPEHDSRAVAVLLVPVAAAVERLGVVEQLLHQVEARERVGVDIVLPAVVALVADIDGSVGSVDEPREIGALLLAQVLGRLVGGEYALAVTLDRAHLLLFLIIVDFHKPSTTHHKRAGLIVGLLGDIHPVGLHTDDLGEHV